MVDCCDEYMVVTCNITGRYCDAFCDCRDCEIANEYEDRETKNKMIDSLKWIVPDAVKENYLVNMANTIGKFESLNDAMEFVEKAHWREHNFKKYILKEEIQNMDIIYPEWWKLSNWFHINDIEYYMFDEPTNLLIVVTTNGVYIIAPKLQGE